MATLEYHVDRRGYPGYTVSTTTPMGNTYRQVIPAFSLVNPDGTSPAVGSAVDPYSTTAVPSSSTGSALTPVVASGATSLVVKNSAGNFYGGSMVAGATAGFLIAYNATAAPAGGAALTAAQILSVAPVSANGYGAIGDYAIPDRFSTGVVLLFSTSTTTYTVPANAALFMRGRAA